VILSLWGILLLTMTGLLPGRFVALLLFRLLGGYVFGVASSDPVAVTLAIAGSGLISVLATILPLRRALNIEPMRILRGN
jgi:ABC-type lipoprotein release transport system permease subunit